MDPEALEGTSAGNNGGFVAVADTIRKLQKDDKAASTSERVSRLTAADNSSAPFEISAEETERLVTEMRKLAREKGNKLVEHADEFWLLATLRARKGDVKRSVALASNYLEWRQKVDYDGNTPASSGTMKEIMEAGLFVLAGNKSRDGRPVLTVRYRFFNPRRYSALDTARAFAYIVEWMLHTYPTSQTHGVVVVEDVAGFSFKNFDLRLVSFMEKAFTSIMPMRISALHIANPGLVIRSMFAIFSAFFSDKIKARIRLFGKGDEDKFAEFFERDQILDFLNLGGTLPWTDAQQAEVTLKLITDSARWGPASTYLPSE